MQRKLPLFIVLLLLLSIRGFAQISRQDFFVLAEENGKTLQQLADEKKEAFGLDLIFTSPTIGNTVVQNILVKKHFFDMVEDIFPNMGNLRLDDHTYLFLDNGLKAKITDDQGKVLVFFVNENTTSIKGRLVDMGDLSPVTDAAIFLPDEQKGNVTDKGGFFDLDTDRYYTYAEIKHPGVAKLSFIVLRKGNAPNPEIQIEVENRENFLDELLVTATKVDANVEDHRSGIQLMSIQSIKKIPTFLGEIDPIRSITTLPGVTSTGDLGAGFNVRGGATSQNLIVQDGGLIFNPSHLFGFFSSFNPDVIQSVKLLKGCGPSNYGGRVASVLELQTRNGDMNKYKVGGGIGVVSSRLSVEGPIKRGRASFLLSGRKSYSDWLINSYKSIELQNSSSKFHDLTGKLFFSIGKANALSITGYKSFDSFQFYQTAEYGWETENLSVNYHHNFSKKLGADLNLAKSKYSSSEISDDELFGYKNGNGVDVYTGNLTFDYSLTDKYKVKFGVQANQYEVLPGKSDPYNDISQSDVVRMAKQYGLETAAFVENSIDINKWLGMDLGLRYGHFNRMGPGTFYTLDYENRNGREASLADSSYYDKNQTAYSTGAFEPRLSFRLKTGLQSSVKLGYTRTQQFIQQISPTISPSPIDYWVLSSNNLKAQLSNQFSVGYFKNFNDNKVEASIEAFYNRTFNTLDYLDGVDLKLNTRYEAGLAQGLGEAYGMEFYVKKRGGLLNGWISYTWSRSWRLFESPYPAQEVNFGKRYPSIYDQPHQLSIVLNYQLPKRIEFSSNITYNSGRPMTIPISKYSYGTVLAVNNYSERNQYRSPDYMRMDISFTFNGKEANKDRWFSGDLIFSIFNLLARKNPYAIWFDSTGQAFKTSVLGTAFPSLTYNFTIQ
ncbi:TonB-dependent receptor plug domain-containing protein [Marinilongibacter aquaticus]|uniref:TonB-dependent receptor plug domain-containing protein n=1 Tax=Marinilongibacter aquaticus TaxID=2975157 RepID=UPI0021BDE2E4|nr:TonB-dependent receptor [Marinilongibacter aquaticus]UBM59870.1 TonB-dependent receptor plug domain-containing protein [Marinilongibacter aquaticus]